MVALGLSVVRRAADYGLREERPADMTNGAPLAGSDRIVGMRLGACRNWIEASYSQRLSGVAAVHAASAYTRPLRRGTD